MGCGIPAAPNKPMTKENKYGESREAPLFKATKRLLYDIDDLQNFLQRDKKHTHGQHMLNIVLEMLSCVSFAYDFPNERAERLKRYLTLYNNLCTILEMCEKKGYLIHKGRNYYVELLQPLGVAHRQVKGWLANTTKSESADGNAE